MEPGLVLHCPHTLVRAQALEVRTNRIFRLSRNHRWTQTMDGQVEERRGTLLLFDLQTYPIPWYKAMTRVTPAILWQDGERARSVIGEREVYLANTNAAAAWTTLLIAALGAFIGWMSWQSTKGSGRPWLACVLAGLANADGSLSASRAQLGAWTTAIGAVVLGFGLIRLEVPDIPQTLLALMGLSLTTGGLSALKEPVASGAGNAPLATGSTLPATPVAVDPLEAKSASFSAPPMQPFRLSDLISSYNKETQQREVSVAKSQMIFWTILTLVMFVTKSLTDGVLWPVPWQMVALMGMSQAGYVAPKFITLPKAES